MSTIKFKFKNINSVNNKSPQMAVHINNNEIYKGQVLDEHVIDVDLQEQNILKIYFINKEDPDTVIQDGKIVQDLNFELEYITMDHHNIKDLIWKGKYVSKDSVIPSCLFFGPRGYFELHFEYPILKWILKTNHEDHNDDPTWEQDYNYYIEACELLNNIQKK
tara:strand:- start:133 stop:621 length:489 start_codon:yes stop_codon:yes gene_type:complete